MAWPTDRLQTFVALDPITSAFLNDFQDKARALESAFDQAQSGEHYLSGVDAGKHLRVTLPNSWLLDTAAGIINIKGPGGGVLKFLRDIGMGVYAEYARLDSGVAAYGTSGAGVGEFWYLNYREQIERIPFPLWSSEPWIGGTINTGDATHNHAGNTGDTGGHTHTINLGPDGNHTHAVSYWQDAWAIDPGNWRRVAQVVNSGRLLVPLRVPPTSKLVSAAVRVHVPAQPAAGAVSQFTAAIIRRTGDVVAELANQVRASVHNDPATDAWVTVAPAAPDEAGEDTEYWLHLNLDTVGAGLTANGHWAFGARQTIRVTNVRT